MNLSKMVVLFVVLNACAWMMPRHASAQQVTVSFQVFYDELTPFGTWVEYPDYGYVWIPNADPGFSPYATSGHWVYTDDGWTWVSDYPWGWAAFHYGRWGYDNTYGWFWVPDDEWGPAWVSWRRSPGYYGWAPLQPGISISAASGKDHHERNASWTFVREKDLTRSDVSHHYIKRNTNSVLIKNSKAVVNTRKDEQRNATYITGPERTDVQKVTHTTITPVVLREAERPEHHLGNGEYQTFRPQVQKKNEMGQHPAPLKVAKLNAVKPVKERNAVPQPRAVQPSKNVSKGPQPKSREVKPPVVNGPHTRPQNAAPRNETREAQPAQPRPNQGEKENRNRK